MAGEPKEVRERSENERMDIQQERIDLAARELTAVSGRLQSCAPRVNLIARSEKAPTGANKSASTNRFVKPS